MRHFLDLNYDVLHLIVTLLSRNDILRLALSCRMGFDLALPQILYRVKLRNIRILDPYRLCDFCSFVLADVVQRGPLLRILELDLEMYTVHRRLDNLRIGEYVFPTALTKILEHASNLRELAFKLPEKLIQDHPSLLSAAVALPHLDSLRVSTSALGQTIISSMISRPRRLALNSHRTTSNCSWDTLVSSLLQSGVTAYVENLHLIGDRYLSAMPSLKFPWLRHLAISKSHIPFGSSFDLAVACPNLHSIHWEANYIHRERNSSTTLDKNIVSITTRLELDHVHLRRCDILPVVGPVRRLTLTSLYDQFETENIATALGRAAPVILHVNTTGNNLDLAQLPAVAPSIRFLRLQVHPTWVNYRPPLSLCEMPLKAVSILVEVHCREKYDSKVGSLLAEQAARDIPSVEYVEVNLCAYRPSPYYDHQRDRTAWHRVTSREADKCTVEKLPQWESDKVEDRLLAMTRV
ncbi:hypothetical protein POSPLADRAFT_1138738 [Postia placenta MAD-698-R-SB12]|uniref:F-box domain-containing protein n=1 Tax=Postia placenta MAD-698-R-SB12 TaxID=670580 RepID=A0A1X6N471_9APHY|nr:hypothetical protein POSPLADRAFT_1138738 [Postia placenta MAD-698-R-SB12]OSX63408.1 hypothetical protein POSPLADRAFT_1138738 [Postia placenta MAD-698-R-SB12]